MNLKDRYLKFRQCVANKTIGNQQFYKKQSTSTPSKDRAWEIYMDKCLQYAPKDGLYLEFGVASGETINFISKYVLDKTVYGFDTFTGLPENWGDVWPAGYFAQHSMPKCRENVTLVPGLFETTLVPFLREHLKEHISFVHIDCDLYSATKYVLEKLDPLLVSGSILCFDEIVTMSDGYFSDACMNGEFRAFNEFVEKYSIEYTLLYYSDVMACIEVAK
jgi:hypothetical protein